MPYILTVFYIFVNMKKMIWLFIASSVMCSCTETADEQAAPTMAAIESLYKSGKYVQVLDSIQSLRQNYPAAVESRKKALRYWQNASLKMAQQDIARTDSALQSTTKRIETETDRYIRNLLGVRRDSLKARYEAMCGVVRMIHIRMKQNK